MKHLGHPLRMTHHLKDRALTRTRQHHTQPHPDTTKPKHRGHRLPPPLNRQPPQRWPSVLPMTRPPLALVVITSAGKDILRRIAAGGRVDAAGVDERAVADDAASVAVRRFGSRRCYF